MAEAESYCRHCGAKVEPNSKFCNNCGKPISLAEAAAPAAGGTGISNAQKKTSKKKIIGIVIIAIVGVLVVLGAIGASIRSASDAAAANLAKQISPVNANQPPEVEEKIRFLLGNDPNRINDITERQSALWIIVTGNTGEMAKMIVETDGGWSGALMDGDGVQETVSGYGHDAVDFVCPSGGIFSLSIQQSGSGTMDVLVAQAGRILEQAGTGSQYGVVSFAGSCE